MWAFFRTGLIKIILPVSVEVLAVNCFGECRSLSSITFESGSRLSRIEKEASRGIGVVKIVLPASGKVLRLGQFSECRSLSSVAFEPGSKLRQVGRHAFSSVPIPLSNNCRMKKKFTQ
jgi:hypothetical protein